MTEMRKGYMPPRIVAIKAEPLTAIATSGEHTVGIVDENEEEYKGTFYAKRYDVWDDGEESDN